MDFAQNAAVVNQNVTFWKVVEYPRAESYIICTLPDSLAVVLATAQQATQEGHAPLVPSPKIR